MKWPTECDCNRCGTRLDLKPISETTDSRGVRWATYKCRCGSNQRRALTRVPAPVPRGTPQRDMTPVESTLPEPGPDRAAAIETSLKGHERDVMGDWRAAHVA